MWRYEGVCRIGKETFSPRSRHFKHSSTLRLKDRVKFRVRVRLLGLVSELGSGLGLGRFIRPFKHSTVARVWVRVN